MSLIASLSCHPVASFSSLFTNCLDCSTLTQFFLVYPAATHHQPVGIISFRTLKTGVRAFMRLCISTFVRMSAILARVRVWVHVRVRVRVRARVHVRI